MKKKIILRGAIGFPIGITIGYLFTIFISLGLADGYYTPCVPELIPVMGNEIKAVILQAILCGLLGAGSAAASVIWEIGHWSIVKQTGIYFLILAVIMMPIAYFMYWMEHTLAGFLTYFAIFTLIFVFIWMLQFVIVKINVRKINDKLK